MIITPEIKAKAVNTKTVEELEALAQEAGLSLSAEELANAFAQTHPKTGVLEDDELDNVSGGCGSDPVSPRCGLCGKTGAELFDAYYLENGSFVFKQMCEDCCNNSGARKLS